MKKITSIILYVLLGLGILSVLPAFIYGDNGVDYMLYYTYALLGIAVLATVVMSIINIGKSSGGGKTALIGLAAVVVVLAISYFLASGDPILISGGKDIYDSKFGLIATDMGLYTTYIALGVAIFVALYGAVRNSLK